VRPGVLNVRLVVDGIGVRRRGDRQVHRPVSQLGHPLARLQENVVHRCSPLAPFFPGPTMPIIGLGRPAKDLPPAYRTLFPMNPPPHPGSPRPLTRMRRPGVHSEGAAMPRNETIPLRSPRVPPRDELFLRLNESRDFLAHSFAAPVSLEDAARRAYLSP